jgi:hypothetical protein
MDRTDSPPREFLPALQSPKLKASQFLDYIRFSEFKRILLHVSALLDTEKVKTVAILSAYPQEGRTFFISAMAMGYAILLKKRVLIVNTALKIQKDSLNIRTVYDEQLQYAPVYGDWTNHANRMIDLMSPQMNDEGDVTDADTVDFQIGAYISTFKHNYDLILIDTCALTSTAGKVIDPVVIAGQADASILLTSEQSMNRESLTEVKALLSQWRVRVLGSIHKVRPKISAKKAKK